ncbi:MAG: hypothetical protein QG622_3513 [Actinomycetota bacterium]|nr:hypothetical protein [Actinomycetota bacterium]
MARTTFLIVAAFLAGTPLADGAARGVLTFSAALVALGVLLTAARKVTQLVAALAAAAAAVGGVLLLLLVMFGLFLTAWLLGSSF